LRSDARLPGVSNFYTARRAAIAALNLALAVTLHLLAPAEPIRSDRFEYDSVGRAPFAPGCIMTIYCYRPLAPVLVRALPGDVDAGWRVYQVAANAAAGAILASLTAAPAVASVLIQTSYGFAFTAYDPYAADPLVFVFSALLVWCWLGDRVNLAIALAVVGVFAKETVALIAGVLAIAALIDRPPSPLGRIRWLLPMAVSGAVLIAFHAFSRVWLGWQIESNPAAQLEHGSWIGLWFRNNPSHVNKLFMVFSVFGFAWLFAALAWTSAARRWRVLALAVIAPMLFLIVIQTPERALGNMFFVVAPLAATYAVRDPLTGWMAVGLNALITAKAGTSSVWLPSARWTLLPAAIAAVVLIVRVSSASSRADRHVSTSEPVRVPPP
jgi:hypothetical protein